MSTPTNAQTPNQPSLQRFWDRLTPKQKKYSVFGLFGLAFVILTYPFLSEPPRNAKAKTGKESKIANVLTSADTHELGLSGVQRELDRVKREIQEGRSKQPVVVEKVEPARAEPSEEVLELKRQMAEQQAQIASLLAQQQAPREAPAPPGTVGNPVSPVTSRAGAPFQQGQPGMQPAVLRIRTIEDAPPEIDTQKPGLKPTANTTAAPATPNAPARPVKTGSGVYIPSGTLITGVNITGVDAPTARGAMKDPLPMLIRVKHEAILPSRYQQDIREAFILAACYGDLPSERVYCRGEALSLVRSDGKVIDTKIEASATGHDGKTGIRGRVVSKQGALIGKAMLAGFADGVSRAFGSTNYVGGGVATQGLSPESLQSGIYGGASSGLDRLSQHFIEEADQMHPVIECDAGQQVSFIVLKGTELELASTR